MDPSLEICPNLPTWFITSKQTEPEAKSILGWYILFMKPMLKMLQVIKWQNWVGHVIGK